MECVENSADDLLRCAAISPNDEIVRGEIGNVNAVVVSVSSRLSCRTFPESDARSGEGAAVSPAQAGNAGAFGGGNPHPEGGEFGASGNPSRESSFENEVLVLPGASEEHPIECAIDAQVRIDVRTEFGEGHAARRRCITKHLTGIEVGVSQRFREQACRR
ncbi:hypothetical protein HYV74_02460 [Candidatus Uhrbacteria bacterium]|nr:hypothetical protein [Candidatus Uhrbacteria bacterium]